VRLSNGRVVSNPLAKTIRFAGETRGDEQFTGSPLHAVNLRLGRSFRLQGLRIDPALDLMNLTNHDAFYSFMSGANQRYSPNYRLGATRQLPRSVQVSVRATF
jgi:hypothetical protein